MATLSGHLLENSKNLWVTLHLGISQSSYGEKTTLEAAAFPWLRTKRPTPCDALRTLLAEDATNLNMAAEMRTIFSEFGLFPPRENTPTSSNPYTQQPKHTVLRDSLNNLSDLLIANRFQLICFNKLRLFQKQNFVINSSLCIDQYF